MSPVRFINPGNGPRYKAEPAGSPFQGREATGRATWWRRTVLFSAAGVLSCTLGAVAFLGLPRALAQTRPEVPAESGGYGYSGGATEVPAESGGYGYSGGATEAPPVGMDNGYGYVGRATGTDSFGGYGGVAQSPRQKLEARLAPALDRLRQAEDDKQKEDIKRELSSILESYFDNDVQQRLSDITLIEERVRQLRDRCEQRQQAKQEIIELQLKVLENEAAGLGFFDPGSPGTPMGLAGSRAESGE